MGRKEIKENILIGMKNIGTLCMDILSIQIGVEYGE